MTDDVKWWVQQSAVDASGLARPLAGKKAVLELLGGADAFCCKKLCICDADLQPGFNTDGPGPKLARDSYNVPIPTACMNATSCTQ